MSTAQPAPADRRAFLGGSLGLAAAVAATATPVALAAVPAEHADAELLDLGAQLAAAVKRQREHDRECDAACDRYQAPPIPEALIHRPEDRRSICSRPDKLAVYAINGQDRPCYEGGLSDLSHNARRFMAGDENYKLDFFPFTPAHAARVREIVAAHDAWMAAIKEAEDVAGVTAAVEGGVHEEQVIEELRRQIAGIRARTLPGLIVKAEAAAVSISADTAWIIDEHLPEMLEGWGNPNAYYDRFRILALSLVADALQMTSPATAGTGTAA